MLIFSNIYMYIYIYIYIYHIYHIYNQWLTNNTNNQYIPDVKKIKNYNKEKNKLKILKKIHKKTQINLI